MQLKDILDKPIAGNFYQDGHIFNAIDKYIRNPDNSVEDRIRALRHIDILMGEGNTTPYPNAKELVEYISEAETNITLETIATKYRIPLSRYD